MLGHHLARTVHRGTQHVTGSLGEVRELALEVDPAAVATAVELDQGPVERERRHGRVPVFELLERKPEE